MQHVTLLDELPTLERPVLVAAFEGWNDAGEAATIALDVVGTTLAARPFATIDAEDFFDFQSVRPTVRTDEAGERVVEWPQNRIAHAVAGSTDRDLVLLDGTEPSMRWRTFSSEVLGLARSLDVELIITLGALQVDVPHTRAVPLTVSASTVAVADAFDVELGSYEGPTGITGVLHAEAAQAGIASISAWAGVPHYLSSTAYLPGALALAERLATLVGSELPLDRLARDAARQTDEIASLVASDEDLAEYVAELEQRSGPSRPGPDIVTQRQDDEVVVEDDAADDLTTELERFLRDNGER